MKQKIIPSCFSMRDFEKFLECPLETGIFVEVHVAQLKNVYRLAKQYNKRMIYHLDMIQGLKNDEYAAEYICQEFKPQGVISTKSNIILKAKQKGVTAIQRIFLLDSRALEKSFQQVAKSRPDYIEVLPGIIPAMIKEVKEELQIPVLAGGLIRTEEEVKNALAAGAAAITTSKTELWRLSV